MLDKISKITEDGSYKSKIANKDKRLGIFLAGLIRGRFCVVLGSDVALRNSLTIALRFSAVRLQFGEPEKSILDYQLHRCRLIPHLAKLFALRSGTLYLYDLYCSISTIIREHPEAEELLELHAILSALKSLASAYSIAGIQECRECTGGLGYSAHSRLGSLRNSVDVMLTWEGENNVLIQQTGKYIFKQIQNTFKGVKITAKSLIFLKLNPEEFEWPIKCTEDVNSSNISRIFEAYINNLAMKSLLKIQENSSKYAKTEDIWNSSQANYIQTLSQAFGDYILYQRLNEMAEKIYKRCKITGEVIKKLCDLYALDVWEKKQRIYVELKCPSELCAIIRDKHSSLCMELGDESIGIIDCIASSDRFIGSVLGNSDGQIYTRVINAVENEKNVYDKPSWINEIIQTRKQMQNL